MFEIVCILQDIYSFGNLVSCGNAANNKEHKLMLQLPFYHSDHLVLNFRLLSGLPPLLYPLTKFTYSLTYKSKHCLVPVYICMFYRYLESRKPSLQVSLDCCNDQVCQMKYSIQEPDLAVSTCLLLYLFKNHVMKKSLDVEDIILLTQRSF